MAKKLSEIVSLFKEEFPNVVTNTKIVAEELDAKGILYKPTSGGGRRLTKMGKDTGAYEELREKDGEIFFQVLYDENAENIVTDIIKSMYGLIPAEPVRRTRQTNNRYNYSRTKYHELCHDYPGHIILLEGPYDKIWTYDESAVLVAKLFNTEPHLNAGNQIGLTFNKEDVSLLLTVLQKFGVGSYVEWATQPKEYKAKKYTNAKTKTHIVGEQKHPKSISEIKRIPTGVVFGLEDNSDNTMDKCMLIDFSNKTMQLSINRNDGTTEIIEVPQSTIDVPTDIQKISTSSPMGEIIMNVGYNQTFTHQGITYIAKEIN